MKGMDASTLQRYLLTRKQVDENADLIISLSSIISAFETWPDDRITISPHALGKLNHLITRHTTRILSALEDFATVKEVEDYLEQLETGQGGGKTSVL